MLLGILGILLIFAVIVIIVDSKKGERSFRAKMIDEDTSGITRIIIDPRSEKASLIELSRKKDGWNVSSGKETYSADQMMIANILAILADMKPQRVVARNKSAWSEYDVTDSAATKIKVYAGKKRSSELYIGRFNYQQPKNQQQSYYGQQRGTLSTYVRLAGDNEVYVVEGFLGMSFNRTVSDFRDKTLLKSNPEDWTRLVYDYPADSSFTLTKENGKWMIGSWQADSVLVSNYFRSISALTNASIVENPLQRSQAPVYALKIEGNNFTRPLTIEAFPADTTTKFLITSSMNEGVFFDGAHSGLTERIFIDQNKLLGKGDSVIK